MVVMIKANFVTIILIVVSIIIVCMIMIEITYMRYYFLKSSFREMQKHFCSKFKAMQCQRNGIHIITTKSIRPS